MNQKIRILQYLKGMKNRFSGMKKGFLKKTVWCATTAALLLSNTFPSSAASQSDVTPGDYVFMTVLQACGINAWNVNKQWESAYRGYLEATGNTAMLNRLNSYNSLSWGGKATGINDLYQSLKGWLSQSSAYGTNARFYTLPSKASPAPDKVTASGQSSIRSAPFSDVNPIPDSGYEYLFSDLYFNTNDVGPYYGRRNVYKPSGVEVFGIVYSFAPFTNTVYVGFYRKDLSNTNGYVRIDVKSMNVHYYVKDDSLLFKYMSSISWNWTVVDIGSVMNFPFKVFSNTDDAKIYVQTGVANNLFSSNKCSLWWHSENGVNLSLQKTNALAINDTITLPSSNADAMAAYNNAAGNLPLTTVTDRLKACGLTASFDLPYTVEYYQDGELKKSVTGNTTTLSPTLDTLVLETFPGYKLDLEASSTFPFTISEENNTIKLYYQSYDLPYSVEYYNDGKLVKTINSTVSSLSPEVTNVPSYLPPGFKLDGDSGTKLPYPVGEENNVIKVYYVTNEKSPVTVSKKNFKNIGKELAKIVFYLIPAICAFIALVILIRIIVKLLLQAVKKRP